MTSSIQDKMTRLRVSLVARTPEQAIQQERSARISCAGYLARLFESERRAYDNLRDQKYTGVIL